jgi:sugar O-acyltransferase (sialic acid O-acetyltransferase NeuD family)
MAMEPLVILGTGGSAYDVLDIIEAINAQTPTWDVRGFLDDALAAGADRLALPVLGRLEDAAKFEGCRFVNCIGSDRSYRKRPEVIARTGLAPDRFATLVHPAASVSARARLGRGTYVNFGASIGGGVNIGDHVSVGPGAIVGHDTMIDDFAMLAPGAVISGFTKIERGCYVGTGAVIRQHVTVGPGARVGMGAVVTRNVAAGSVVVGNPARPLESMGRPLGVAEFDGHR